MFSETSIKETPILSKKSAFLLQINHVLDLKNSKLHKHHLSLSLLIRQIPNQVSNTAPIEVCTHLKV